MSEDTDSAPASPSLATQRPVTLRDVAREAGVSVATASRALGERFASVNPQARAKVVESARRLGYEPNMSARATTTGSTATVAVVVSDIRDPYNALLVHGAIEAANRAGLLVTIAGTESLVEDETRVVRTLRSMRPRSIVLTGARSGPDRFTEPLLQELRRYTGDGGRVVVVGDDVLPFDTAVIPRRRGAEALVGELAGLGYRSPALLIPAVGSAAVQEWEAGVAQGARATGMRIGYDTVLHAPASRDGGYGATVRLLESGIGDVDVVVAATDLMAIGAMSAVRDSGLRPGLDVAIAGFGDVVGADDVTPGLTTVDLSLAAAGTAALELSLRSPAEQRRLIDFDARVVVRGSTPARR